MSLDDWITRHAERTPEKPAIRFPGVELSYAQLAQQVRRISAALAAAGIGRGDRIAWLGYNRPEMLATLFAAARLGALLMPLNWRLAAPEHRQMLDDCPAAVLIVEPDFVTQTETIRATLPAALAVTFGAAPPGWQQWEDFLARGTDDASIAPGASIDADAPVLVCYTSGSTGKPKGVLLSQRALSVNAENSAAMHALRADDRILTTLPLFHVGGLNNQTTPALHAGCTVVLHPRFDVAATFDAIEHERITLTVLVPAQLEQMIAHPRWASANLSSLRMITTGSTIVAESLIRAVAARGIPLVQIYGATETCPISACQQLEDATRFGAAGRAARHCELRVVDDTGRELGAGERGEVLVRGANLMSGYWNDPAASAAALAGGWFHSGDIGHFDADGHLWIDGRKKDLIISGSENIYPAEIENVLAECADIAEVAVVGRADPRWGEVIVAVVVARPSSQIDAAAVLALLEGRIARFKHPKAVVFVDALPKTALGKVRKEAVRALAEQHAAQAPLAA